MSEILKYQSCKFLRVELKFDWQELIKDLEARDMLGGSACRLGEMIQGSCKILREEGADICRLEWHQILPQKHKLINGLLKDKVD